MGAFFAFSYTGEIVYFILRNNWTNILIIHKYTLGSSIVIFLPPKKDYKRHSIRALSIVIGRTNGCRWTLLSFIEYLLQPFQYLIYTTYDLFSRVCCKSLLIILTSNRYSYTSIEDYRISKIYQFASGSLPRLTWDLVRTSICCGSCCESVHFLVYIILLMLRSITVPCGSPQFNRTKCPKASIWKNTRNTTNEQTYQRTTCV